MGAACQEQLGHGEGPHTSGDVCVLCLLLPCHDTNSCSQHLPAKGLFDAQSQTRAAWNNISMGNADLCVWTCSVGDVAGTSTVSSRLFSPQFPLCAHICSTLQLTSLPSLSGWKWFRGISSLKDVTKLEALSFLGSRPIC